MSRITRRIARTRHGRHLVSTVKGCLPHPEGRYHTAVLHDATGGVVHWESRATEEGEALLNHQLAIVWLRAGLIATDKEGLPIGPKPAD